MYGACHHSMYYQPIEDYGVIGDLHTVALVGKNGSIDWCCLPRFDSPSVFGRILDYRKGGFFLISPRETKNIGTKQLYLPDTNILITRFLTIDGVGELIDFMPIKDMTDGKHLHHLIRIIRVVRGSLDFVMHCRPAFNYAQDSHVMHVNENGVLFYTDQLQIALESTVPIEDDGENGACSFFSLTEGKSIYFSLESATGCDAALHRHPAQEYERLFQHTRAYWHHWISQCRYRGRWREMVNRSALVLKLLAYEPSGAIIAAPTTSLPETIGGQRNWDYRYTWLRDAAFTLYSLLLLGFTQEARAFMNWLDDRCHEIEDGGRLQPIYGINGEHKLTEVTLDHLEGYCQSGPVRIGNEAYSQLQLDTYGELLDAIFVYNRYNAISYDLWQSLRRLLVWLEANWNSLDRGIWEVRGEPQPFVHSRLMSWVAFDRALRIANHRGWPGPVDYWKKASNQIYEEIMELGWSSDHQSFVQHYNNTAVDASALLMSITKFTGATDPRMLQTVKRIQCELARDSLVYRYNPTIAANDGLGSHEGTFSPCSFWLAEALANAGKVTEAHFTLENILTYANHLGLYAEEIGPTGEALGNYPQGFTHLALITACYKVDQALSGLPTGLPALSSHMRH